MEEQIIDLTNQERERENLPPLELNEDLTVAAKLKLADMFSRNYFSHTSPSGLTPWYFLNKVNYDFSTAGENLARDYFSPTLIVDAWMKSATHRQNILNPDFAEVGIAAEVGNFQGEETQLVVQILGNRERANTDPAGEKENDTSESPNKINNEFTENYSANNEVKKIKPFIWLGVIAVSVPVLLLLLLSIYWFRKRKKE